MKLPDGWVFTLKAKDAAIDIEGKDLILCKNCKYFEYDTVAKVDDIPLIVGHEMCKRWGDGCKTSENGYCFLAEKKSEDDKNVRG